MSGFLSRFAAASRERVKAAQEREPPAELRARAQSTRPAPPLTRQGSFDIIAEYKRHSPSLGRLEPGDDRLAPRVSAYARGGAAAVSVLTEPTHFHGELSHLVAAAAILAPLGVPVMRKDFLVDPYQLYEARAAGAGGVLLIVRLLTDAQLGEMIDCAVELGMFVLVEAFDADDVGRATAGGTLPRDAGRSAPVLLGVNCRDLETLETVPYRFRELASMLPTDVPRVAESGISMPEDCADIARAGYGLALVGSALMRETNPVGAIRAMLAAGRAAVQAVA